MYGHGHGKVKCDLSEFLSAASSRSTYAVRTPMYYVVYNTAAFDGQTESKRIRSIRVSVVDPQKSATHSASSSLPPQNHPPRPAASHPHHVLIVIVVSPISQFLSQQAMSCRYWARLFSVWGSVG